MTKPEEVEAGGGKVSTQDDVDLAKALQLLALRVDRDRLWYFLITEVADLFDDVWWQFAYKVTVKGKPGLWHGGLSTLEAVESMREKLAEFKTKYVATHPEPPTP